MNAVTFHERAAHAAQLAETGDVAAARDLFAELARSDLTAPSRCMMAVNAGNLSRQLGDLAAARQWFDLAVDLESLLRPTFAIEHQAAALAEMGDLAGGARLYRRVLDSGHLDEAGIERVRANLAIIETRLG